MGSFIHSRFASSERATLLLGLIAVACAGGVPDRGESVLLADRARAEAMVAGDVARLTRVLHESLTYTHSNGRIDTRSSLIDGLRSGRIDYRGIGLTGTRVRVHGRSAVVTGRAHIDVAADGRVHRLNAVYTAVYWWEGDRWQLSAYQSSPAASE